MKTILSMYTLARQAPLIWLMYPPRHLASLALLIPLNYFVISIWNYLLIYVIHGVKPYHMIALRDCIKDCVINRNSSGKFPLHKKLQR